MRHTLVVLSLLWGIPSTASKYPLSNHYDGKKFFNINPVEKRNFLDIFKWRWEGGRQEWPTQVANTAKPNFPSKSDPNRIHITYINHASSLIQIDGVNIITDPMFSERASPIEWIGPKRVRAPGAQISELPNIHYVIISHNHYDHLDLPSLRQLNEKFHPHFLVPLGNAELLKGEGIEKVTEMDWEQTFKSDNVLIDFLSIQHWSARGLFDRFETLWGAYYITIGKWKILFVGDAGYSNEYKKIYEKKGAPDVSILPIGAYEPRWFMKTFHMNPEEAVQAHLDLKSRYSVASHFGCFQLTNEAIDQPPKDLELSLKKNALSQEQFKVLEVGQTKEFHK